MTQRRDVHGGAEAPRRTIVVGVDGTDASNAAVAWAAAYASSSGIHVLAVHAVPEPWLWGVAALQIDSDPLIATRRSLLLGRWTEPLRDAGVDVSTHLHVGDPTAELLGAAHRVDAELIVIGARRHSALHDLAERGTAHKLPDLSEVPVVVVPVPSAAVPRGGARLRPDVAEAVPERLHA